MSGPLSSLRVVEFSGLGPAPLAGQLLADLGAEVITVDRKPALPDPTDVNRRGKKSVVLDLKSDAGLRAARHLIAASDVLIEGFRPGVMERLGLGPEGCAETLIYARMTGWGQTGPLAQTAGHDINYLALSGALHAMGEGGRPPVPPLNMVADYGGGTMFLIFGILSAVIERGVSGKGQVVDAAMVDGVPAMMGLIHAMLARGTWQDTRASNWLDGAAPFYRCYTCADGKFVAVGALEPQFYALLLEKLGLPAALAASQNDPATWADRTGEFAALFAAHPRDPHPHNQTRATFAAPNGVTQASPAPRFSRSQTRAPQPPTAIGADTAEVFAALHLDAGLLAAITPAHG